MITCDETQGRKAVRRRAEESNETAKRQTSRHPGSAVQCPLAVTAKDNTGLRFPNVLVIDGRNPTRHRSTASARRRRSKPKSGLRTE